ncbi:MAG: YceI family protein [Pelagibacterales bacterium]|nr:YceI family protein [Pelagibacterales bacterium]
MNKFLLILLLLLPSTSIALERWNVVNTESNIKFSIKVLFAEDVFGEFSKFNGVVEVDRKNFEGTANFEIDISSISTNYDFDYKDLIRGEMFFDIKNFKKATLQTKDFLINRDNTAQAFAELKIKGIGEDLKIPLDYRLVNENRTEAKGTFIFKRTNFGIGSGIWSNTWILKDDVKVDVNIVLKKFK